MSVMQEILDLIAESDEAIKTIEENAKSNKQAIYAEKQKRIEEICNKYAVSAQNVIASMSTSEELEGVKVNI